MTLTSSRARCRGSGRPFNGLSLVGIAADNADLGVAGRVQVSQEIVEVALEERGRSATRRTRRLDRDDDLRAVPTICLVEG